MSDNRNDHEEACSVGANGELLGAKIVRLVSRRRSNEILSPMQLKQGAGSDVLPFPLERLNHRRPRGGRNASASPPLDDRPMTLTEVRGHLSQGAPGGEYVVNGCGHDRYIARDELSRQVGLGFPVRKGGRKSENSRMGRARSPIQFNKDLALRLKSARIAAGYERAQDFAKELGIEYERYKKWESGRTPIQHEYLPQACRLTGKDANYFYGIRQPVELELPHRRTGAL